MKVPEAVHKKIKDKLWAVANERNWPTMPESQKTALYEDWFRDVEVGGVLARYLPPGNIRVYLKDTIMKPYARDRIKDFAPIQRLLGLPQGSSIAETYSKPHGRLLTDGRVICWGLSRDWKMVLFAVFERAYAIPSGIAYAAVIMFPTGKYQQPRYRQMIEAAARKLEIETLKWYDE